MTAATDDEIDELEASFGWSPRYDTPLGLDACLAACCAWLALASAEEVYAGRTTEFDAGSRFANTIVACPLFDSDARRATCADAFKAAFAIGLADLRSGIPAYGDDL